MLAAGGGYSAATGNLDSFAGGFTGGMFGYMAGSGFGKSAQFQNWKTGNSPILRSQIKDSLTVKPFSRSVDIAGAKHTGWATEDGMPLLDMGPENGTGKIKLNVYQNLDGKGIRMGAQGTWENTQAALKNGTITYGTPRIVSAQAFSDAASAYATQYAGRQYNPVFENSNFAADWVGSHSGAGYANGVGWDPDGFSFPWNN